MKLTILLLPGMTAALFAGGDELTTIQSKTEGSVSTSSPPATDVCSMPDPQDPTGATLGDRAVTGGLRIAVLLVSLPNHPAPTPSEATAVMSSASGYYQEVSYGKLWLESTIWGPLSIPSTVNAANRSKLLQAALALAQSMGMQLTNYDRTFLAYPPSWGNSGPGVAIGNTFFAHISAQALGVLCHELAHTIGWGHLLHTSSGTGTYVSNSYSHPTPPFEGNFTAPFKDLFGWFSPDQRADVHADGIFRLTPLDDTGPGLKTLRVFAEGSSGSPPLFYVETRIAPSTLSDMCDHTGGAILHRNWFDSLDPTPETPDYLFATDACLFPGRTCCPSPGVFATVLSRDGNDLWVQIRYRAPASPNASPLPGGIATCIVPLPDGRQEIQFHAAATDPDGDELSYFWCFEKGPVDRYDGGPYYLPGRHGPGATLTHVFPDASPRRVTVRISDRKGGECLSRVDLFGNLNDPPQISGIAIDSVYSRYFKMFRAQAVDPDQDDLAFRWDFGDGTTSTWPAPLHGYTADGLFTVTLTVSDAETSVTSTTTVDLRNRPPVARAGPDVCLIDSNHDGLESVLLDGHLSSDPEGDALNGIWYQNGTYIGAGLWLRKMFPLGTSVVELRVTDRGKPPLTSVDFVTVRVLSRPMRADAVLDCSINILDLNFLVDHIYRGGPAPTTLEQGDANSDGLIDSRDVDFLVNYLFRGGPPPGP